jgi:hypothetical protein
VGGMHGEHLEIPHLEGSLPCVTQVDMGPVDRPFSNGGQLMCHEVFIYVEDIIGSTWVSDTQAQNFVIEISAPLRGLIM